MALNIKNSEAHALANELARRTGKSLTAVVIDALRQQLEQTKRQERKAERVKELIARQAYRDFGKGRHPASLNFGDCFAYALSKETGEPLLFKGNDFGKTDIAVHQTS